MDGLLIVGIANHRPLSFGLLIIAAQCVGIEEMMAVMMGIEEMMATMGVRAEQSVHLGYTLG